MMMTLNRAIFIYLFIIRIRILDGGGGLTSYDFVIAMNQPGGATVATFNGLLRVFPI
jgi:hypothetical protein